MPAEQSITYKGFTLDTFQRQALLLIDQGRSVVVSAPTGVGKTLIADYLIEKAVREGKRIIYTAPIKALSNQKYRQFRNSLGNEQVGIITGDVVINKQAPVVMMTTEVYRNMVLTDPARAADIHYLIFDEIHYIDSDRGLAWEESLIFAPSHVKFLGLSATIGNLEQFVGWLSEVRQEDVALVVENRRVVPLVHRFYNVGTGISSLQVMAAALRQKKVRPTDHRQMVQALRRHYLPALFFVFSRRQCVEKSKELLRERTFLSGQEAALVDAKVAECASKYDLHDHAGMQLMARLLHKGIAYHHAGLLPVLKDLVEELFEQRLIKVLYCTETFAVGVNYPVKSVCFVEQRKFDGTSVRPLTAQEYQQMSGRAGRRGIDSKGFVFTLVQDEEDARLVDYANQPLEDIGSQYRLSCNSILNLTRRGEEEQVAIAYQSSFAEYLHVQARKELQQRLQTLQTQRQELQQQTCADLDTAGCPLQYRRQLSKLKGMERDLRRGKTHLKRACAALRKELSQVNPKACSSAEQNSCRRAKRQLGLLKGQICELENQLNALESSGDWLGQYRLIKQRLEHLGYLDGTQILPRGEMASQINFQEIVTTEFVFAGMLDELTPPEICALLAGVDFSGRFHDFTQKDRLPMLRKYFRIADELKQDPILGPGVIYSPHVATLGYRWAKGASFSELTGLTTIEEGDLVSLLRRSVDVLRQLRKAVGQEPFWREKIDQCMLAMERDVVKVEL
jgi:ATP-dependent RNA helicase DOB1